MSVAVAIPALAEAPAPKKTSSAAVLVLQRFVRDMLVQAGELTYSVHSLISSTIFLKGIILFCLHPSISAILEGKLTSFSLLLETSTLVCPHRSSALQTWLKGAQPAHFSLPASTSHVSCVLLFAVLGWYPLMACCPLAYWRLAWSARMPGAAEGAGDGWPPR